MRSRSAPAPARPLGDTKVSGRRVTCKAALAHLERGSGRSKTSPTAILQGTHSLVEQFSEVRLYGVLRRSHPVSQGGIIQVSSDPSGKRTEKEESPCRSPRYTSTRVSTMR